MPLVAAVRYSDQSRQDKGNGFHILRNCQVSREIDEDSLCLASYDDAAQELSICPICAMELRRIDRSEVIRRADFVLRAS